MEIQEIKNKEVWQNFLLDCKEKSFLQSWNWGEFNKKMGDKIWRFGIYENQELRIKNQEESEVTQGLVGIALAIEIKARRGTFLFVPHAPLIVSVREGGPNVENQELRIKNQVLKILLGELKKIARKEKASFIRIAPAWQRNKENIEVFKNLGFRESPIHINPELTWELDIRPSEQELLMQMRKTTRYLIRKALKNEEIQIVKSQDIQDIKGFNKLYRETKERQHFAPFSFEYLKNEFLAFSSDNLISIFLGKYKDEIVSSGIFVFWQGIGFYHHGASSLKYPQIPASYLLLWEAIKTAKERGCEKFNFWGIAPLDSGSRKHPWAGLTLFKMGFGGKTKEYVKTQDLILSQKYWMSYFVERLRKLKRAL